MKKFLLVTAGLTSLSAGVVGIFVPLLPTTPFLLLAGACFLRSSNRFYRWLTGHRILGAYISNYLARRAVTKKSKVVSIAVLWTLLGSSMILAADAVWLKVLLFAVGCGVTVHLSLLKTFRK